MGDPEQFHGKSECGLVRILRYAQDDSVDIRIGIILKGAAVRLHARSARRWALWGRARKGAVSGTSVDSILPWHPKSVQSEDGHLQRCGTVQFNFVAPQSEIVVIWQKSTEVRKE